MLFVDGYNRFVYLRNVILKAGSDLKVRAIYGWLNKLFFRFIYFHRPLPARDVHQGEQGKNIPGFYVVISSGNLVKKIIGLNLFQASVFILYISIGKLANGHAPILQDGVSNYSNPLPHVLILTAIVVGVSTTALGLALVVRIRESYDSVEEEDIHRQDESF